jgi:hypothetical protein
MQLSVNLLSTIRRCIALIVALFVTLVMPLPANAAVRRCMQPVVGPPQAAATELQARKQALEAWAKAAGTVPSAWRLATDKQVACGPVAGQAAPATTCVVRARPCLVDQAPGRDWLPDPGPPPREPAPGLPRPGSKPLNI